MPFPHRHSRCCTQLKTNETLQKRRWKKWEKFKPCQSLFQVGVLTRLLVSKNYKSTVKCSEAIRALKTHFPNWDYDTQILSTNQDWATFEIKCGDCCRVVFLCGVVVDVFLTFTWTTGVHVQHLKFTLFLFSCNHSQSLVRLSQYQNFTIQY